ncbi:MAG TPA: branched-chain amino acid ABC transporter permease [Acidimicrobiales bacterium]|nr:branched-chain amino acid ABC transporter permease [Acidimicrobiales bacterium]
MKLFAQLVVGGVAQGALYALVALGFVIIYKATDVINFAQGGLVLLGAYICFTFNGQWGWPFYPSVLAAMAVAALLGLAIERVILRRMIGQPNYAIIMITIGLSIAIDQIVIWKWTGSQRNFGDPWGLDTYKVGGVVIPVVNVVQIVAAGALLVGFFALFRYSRVGIAMRATASDQEAALAQGISVKRVFGLSWAIAAAIGALAGVLLVSGGRGLGPDLSFVALAAFPAIILGGLDSAGGAVVGGLVMGLVQSLTAGYNDKLPAVLGPNFNRVTPYVVLVAILMVRPYGLFGTREVTRV